jgi:hypothetical protein
MNAILLVWWLAAQPTPYTPLTFVLVPCVQQGERVQMGNQAQEWFCGRDGFYRLVSNRRLVVAEKWHAQGWIGREIR